MPCAVTSLDESELSALASEMARRGDGLETDLRINKDIRLQTLERLLEPHGRDGGSGGHSVHLFTRMWATAPVHGSMIAMRDANWTCSLERVLFHFTD